MSKIGLIAATGTDADDWRMAASIPRDHAPWIESLRDLNGLTLYSIICVPGWESRLSNPIILDTARLHLTRRETDEIAAQEAAIVDAELGVMPGSTNAVLVPEWAEERDDLRRSVRPRTPSIPFPPPGSDEAVCRTMIGPSLFGRMSEYHRRILAEVIRQDRGIDTQRVIHLIQSLEHVYFSERPSPTAPIPPRLVVPAIPFADNFRDVARQERERYEAERAERVARGAERAARLVRRRTPWIDDEG